MSIEPCNICGAEARTEMRDMPRRLGESSARQSEVRVCTSSSCPSNTGHRRLGQSV